LTWVPSAGRRLKKLNRVNKSGVGTTQGQSLTSYDVRRQVQGLSEVIENLGRGRVLVRKLCVADRRPLMIQLKRIASTVSDYAASLTVSRCVATPQPSDGRTSWSMGNSVALILPSLFVLYLDSEITWRMPNQSDGRSEHGSGAVLPDGAPFCLPRQRPRAGPAPLVLQPSYVSLRFGMVLLLR
jgi:hypothetical protein